MVTTDLPLPLRHALELGDCVLFIGAGVGHHLARADGSKLPDAAELATNIVRDFSLDTKSDDLAKVAQLVEIRNRKPDLVDYIRKSFSDLTPDDAVRWLCRRKWRAIYTTNYDRGLERGYELSADAPQTPKSILGTSDLIHCDPRFEVPIYHIHGAIFGNNPDIIISQSDYSRFRAKRRMLFELLKRDFATATFLYIGYSNRDPNWKLLIDEITEEFAPAKMPSAYRLAPSTDRDDIDIFKALGLETINGKLDEFVAVAEASLEPFSGNADRLKAIEKTVPKHMLDAFDKNPAPVARFIASWLYVNQAPFSETPNVQAFFRGDRANWALVGGGLSFQRDAEEDVYEHALDYLTGGATRPTIVTVLGSAGYGVTTILMNVAARMVRERISEVYFLKANAPLLEGDIEFAVGISTGLPVIFFVDDVTDNAQSLANAVSGLKDSKRPALFICGARLNEWRQRNIRLGGIECVVEALSEIEIDRLLDCLATNKELNKLEPLTRELQKAVIREKHGHELLVVLREATEDKRFDAILESEFFGIESEICRQIYLIACCFHQHGSFIRDTLLYELASISPADFHNVTRGQLDGVLVDECVDETTLQYAYRTRHRTIAKIVWDRCGEGSQKDDLLQSAIEHLNLNYRVDVNAFEKFVRNDALIDSIRGLENKIKFFEVACRKEPYSPYVRQHYARMLYRAKKLELALAQVDAGMAINPAAVPRVLIHSKGTILGALALEADSVDIGRRRLAQAEDAFRSALAQQPKDEYAHQALASLYLDWAKHLKDDAQSATYLAKAEEAISTALRKCKVKDALWLVSADIEEWLGHRPEQLKALETAVKETPTSIIARYILGKAYRRMGRYQDAMNVLEPNIKNHHDEFRSFMEFTQAQLSAGKSLREAIATLEIASVAGLSDPRYVAQLAGFNYLQKDFARATAVWAEIERRDLPPAEMHAVAFKPRDGATSEPFRLSGRVVARKPQFAFIEVDGFPQIFCHASKFGRLVLRVGTKVNFELGFTARNAVAINLSEAK